MESSSNHRSGVLTAGGVLSIIAGAIEVIGGLAAVAGLVVGGILFDRIHPFLPMPWMQGDWSGTFLVPLLGALAVPGLALGIVAIIGGAYALRRKSFGMSLAGAICAVLSPTIILGALAVIFVAVSRKEFGEQR
jgi:hypothetical protein